MSGFSAVTRGASPPTCSSSSSSSTSSSSSSSSSSTCANSFAPGTGSLAPASTSTGMAVGGDPMHHRPEPPSSSSCQADQLVSAKQENVDYNYYHSTCNNPPSHNQNPPNCPFAPEQGGCGTNESGGPFPSFYSLTSAPGSNSAARRTADELLSGHGYRFFATNLFLLQISRAKHFPF